MVYAPSPRPVAKFTHFQDAEQIINKLKKFGFSKVHLSIVALDADEQVDEASLQARAEDEIQARVTGATLAGTLLGAVGGCMAGLGFLAIPGIGLILAVGTAQATLTGMIAGAGIGATGCGLLETMTCHRLARQHALLELSCASRYEYVVLVDGTEAEIRQAEAIVRQLCLNEEVHVKHPALVFQSADFG
ncbi:MAG: hypothetical protein HC840_16245 [Leptolyngbyaceae cyanobacterium RM2_2_4]|nr:hypothetical protein [Leptolyngbyaceae cyanobacterium SM1_4_3]NJN56485.1 hypothetical protein [Leptolyngbyaceae cyanobacterium SL_5_9]NJO50734.1 hypothetical protein [Leptolyngbyaceae cyanobacterium RM2_2_4]